MQSIKVKKPELITILETNRAKHREIFEEALEGYQKAVVKELKAQIKRAKAGLKKSVYVSISAPIDQTKSYDRAIAMLKMSVEEEIALSESDFQCYVQDDWGWKDQFLTANSFYSKKAADTIAEQEG